MRSMLMFVGCALASIGCSEDPYRPTVPTDPGTGSGSRAPDAAPVDASLDGGTQTVRGRVCVLDDARDWTACADVDVAAEVSFPGSTLTVAADGSFSADVSAPGAGASVRVSGGALMPTRFVASGGPELRLPVLTTAHFDELVLDSGFLFLDGEGVIAVEVRVDGVRASGYDVVAAPVPTNNPTGYASNVSTVWQPGVTEARGIALIVGAQAGATVVTVQGPAGTQTHNVSVASGQVEALLVDF